MITIMIIKTTTTILIIIIEVIVIMIDYFISAFIFRYFPFPFL